LDESSSVVWQSLADAVNLISIVVPSGVLQTDSTYTFRARHRSVEGLESAWAQVVATTMLVFDWDPSQLGISVDVWMDGLDTSTMTIIDGKVENWASKDSNYRVFSAYNVVGRRPTVVADGVSFINPDDASTDANITNFLHTSLSSTFLRPLVIYAVVSHRHVSGIGVILSATLSHNPTTRYEYMHCRGALTRDGFTGTAAYPDYSHFPQNQPAALKAEFIDSSNRRFKHNLNDELIDNTATNAGGFFSNSYFIGVERSPTLGYQGLSFNGVLHELIVLNAIPSPEDALMLQNYLIARHSIQV
jgi:hypothetical protein